MNLVSYSNNNNKPSKKSESVISTSVNKPSTTSPPTGTSPRNQDTSTYLNTLQEDISNMSNNTVSDQTNQQPPKPTAPLETRGRQDSLSYFTNFSGTGNNNGPRFSTDSNSSISNFLNLPIPGDQNAPAFDANGRGLSIINNLFGAPGSSASQQGSQSQQGQNYFDYNSYSQIRRPSEQLEPFNPSVKLKNPSFSSKKQSATSFNPGTSFSEASSEFDFFSKRDSIKPGRQPSFLNNGTLNDVSDFDVFAKRDSIKNPEDFDFKEPNFGVGTKKTKSEPDINDPKQKHHHQQASGIQTINEGQATDSYLAGQTFRQPALPYNDFQQTLKAQQQQVKVPRNPFTQYQYPKPNDQLTSQQQLQNFQLVDPNGAEQVVVKPIGANIKPPKKSRKINAHTSPVSIISDSTNVAPVGSKTPQQLSPEYSSQSSNIGLQQQDPNASRPLLGATKVDQLMLVIQARKKGVHRPIPISDNGEILDDGLLPPETELVGGIEKPTSKSLKKHQCKYCHKTFTQSTHLEVHVRSHIGLKPFECSYCGKKFTQGGNLRTHLRLHTGEKPYACEVCGKSFSRKGNLAAHKLTHDNLKPFECKLDNCRKSFTQLGNLKAHQNRFHLETLNKLTERLAEVDPNDPSMKNEERELLNYLATLYKNSNRGIKGRGKRTEPYGQNSPPEQSLAGDGLSQESHQHLEHADLPYPQRPRAMEYRSYTSDKGGENISFKDVNYRD